MSKTSRLGFHFLFLLTSQKLVRLGVLVVAVALVAQALLGKLEVDGIVDLLHQLATAAIFVVDEQLQVKYEDGRKVLEKRLAAGVDGLARLRTRVALNRLGRRQTSQRLVDRFDFVGLREEKKSVKCKKV